MNTRADRIIAELQKVGDKGINYTDLFHGDETDVNIRRLKKKVLDKLGSKDAIEIMLDGKWKLRKFYQTVTMTELYQYRSEKLLNRIFKLLAILTTIIIIAIASFLSQFYGIEIKTYGEENISLEETEGKTQKDTGFKEA